MGHAAYIRGNKVISAQIAREVEANRLVSVDRQYLATLEESLRSLTARNEALAVQVQRVTVRYRERSLTVSVERESHAHELEAMTRRAHEAEAAMLRYRRRWEFVSRIVRRLCSPGDVARYREECS